MSDLRTRTTWSRLRLRRAKLVTRWYGRTIRPRPAWGVDFIPGEGWRLRSHY